MQLKRHTPFSVSIDDLFKAAQVAASVGSTALRLDWLDSTIKKIHEGKELQLQFQKVTGLRMEVKEPKLFLYQEQNLLKQGKEKLSVEG